MIVYLHPNNGTRLKQLQYIAIFDHLGIKKTFRNIRIVKNPDTEMQITLKENKHNDAYKQMLGYCKD